MKHTHSRKKMLLSSIAMLLVALVALGSASYAWFTSNPNATAQGIKMKTTAATGLVIRTETDDTWSHNAALRKGETDYFNLNPVSQDQSTPDNFWTVSAAAADAYAAGEDNMTAAVKNTDYYAEKVYFRLSDGSDVTASASKKVYIKGVTITANAQATMQNGIRVAITAADGTMLGTWALATGGAHGTLTTAAKTSGEFSPALATTSTSLDVDTLQTGLTATGSDLSKYVTVYAYLDGQDSVVYSDKVGTVNAAAIIESIKVDFTLK